MKRNYDSIKETTSPRRSIDFWLVVGIVFLATNMRPSLTSVGPLLDSIRSDLHLSNSAAGLITTLPLLAFAVMSPLAPKLARKYGNELVLFVSLLFLMIGLLIRSSSSAGPLFIGTAILGLAIAVLNVLLPAMIKQKFSKQAGLMTGVYSAALGTFAALASGFSVPLSHGLGFGWRGSLVCWAVLAAFTAVIWIPQLVHRERPDPSKGKTTGGGGLWRSTLAWQVTLFMGLQSLGFYVTASWLPVILHDRGLSVAAAGWMLSILQFISIPVNFLTPIIADRLTHQKWLAAIPALCYIAGFGGLMLHSTSFVLLWIIFLGVGQGAALSLSLLLFGLRARNGQQASELSGMAQSVGYLLAAVGPFLFGLLQDVTHSWMLPLAFVVITSVIMLISGIGAGRNKYVGSSATDDVDNMETQQ